MLRQSLGLASRVAGPSRQAVLARRTLVTSPLLHRQDRLPQGHVRARRVSRPVPISTSTSVSGSRPSVGGMGGQLPIEDSMPYYPNIPTKVAVHVPPDPKGVLDSGHGVRDLLANDTLIIVRQLEMMNVFMGYEQANRYAIYNPEGTLVGFLAEEDHSMLKTMTRQFLHTHRPFKATIMNTAGEPILWIRRPFAFINSRIFVHANEGDGARLVGESQQQWHPWRRRYNVFQSRGEETFSQFARIDSGFLAWDFWLKDREDRLLASINRNFRGLGRELFTDTGQYVIRFDSAGTELQLPPGSRTELQGQSLILPDSQKGALTLDQRAMTLATAVSIDFDYFSRHSGSGGFGFPFMMWGMGDGSSDVAQGSRPPQTQGDDPAGGAGTVGGAVTGAGAASGLGGREATDSEMYGPGQEAGRSSNDVDASDSEMTGEGMPRGRGYNEELGWGQDGWENEEVMDDPWQQDRGADDGFFGGGGSGRGGGGDWGDFGDWS